MRRTLAALSLCALASASAADAQTTPQDPEQGPQQQGPPQALLSGGWWAVHGQLTDIFQYHPAFRSAYQGPQSFDHNNHTGNTVDVTLYAGFRPWAGAELWANPELYQGQAPNDTLGIAGYVNGDGAKVGKHHPYTRIARLFLRQTVDLGGGVTRADPDLNQLGGDVANNRLVFTAGKYNLTDLFDANKYAHDARHDFLNWSLIDQGSFDYAADAWGYSYGAAAEWYQGPWTLRLGAFDMSIVPNNKTLTPDLSQFQLVGEVERRFSLRGRPGAVRVAGYVSRADMGRYDDAVALALATGEPADTSLVRRYRSRPGAHLNLEQEVADSVGVFARAGWSDGEYESYEYTDIDRSFSAGVSVQGARWGRKDDTVALAGVVNEISDVHERYLDAGGLGILIGDGRLTHPGDERIVEAYYSASIASGVSVSLDWQHVDNPAYNRDRGPVEVLGARLHLQR